MGILLTPIVTRIYPPESFGLVNFMGSMIMIIGVFSTMGYHAAIILPKKNSDAHNLLLLCLFFTFCISLFSFLIVIIGGKIILEKINIPSLADYLILLPVFVFLHGTYMTLRFWKTRLRYFQNLATSRISEILARKSYQISTGYLFSGVSGNLIYAELVTSLIRNLVLLKGVRFKVWSFKRMTFFKIIAVAKRYKKFPQFSLWSDLLSRLPFLIISFSIIKYFGEDLLGYYSLSLMVLSLPSKLISGSINEAFIPRIAEAKHQNKHTDLLENVYTRLVSIMLFPFLILGLFSDQLFPLVFGPDWVESGLIAKILLFQIFFEIIFSPSLSIVDIINRQEIKLIQNIFSILISIISLSFGVYYENFYIALWLVSILQGVLILILGIFVMGLIKFPFKLIFKKLSKDFFICLIIAILLVFTNIFFQPNIFGLFTLIIFTTSFYYGQILYFDRKLFESLFKVVTIKIKHLKNL